jgi:mono/diheme cytochrome c family protein
MFKRSLIGLLILAVLVVVAACKKDQTAATRTTNSNTTSAQSTSAMRITYDKDCKSCHGLNGEGGPVKLEDGTKLRVPSLREGHALRHTDAEFVKQITKGGDGMPAFADKLKPEQVDELVRFLRHEFQGK